MKFRKKPIVVEAIRYLGPFSIDEMFEAWGSSFAKAAGDTKLSELVIKTLEGEMIASKGDWIICGVKGEFYPCKPDIFAATYEEISQPGATVFAEVIPGRKAVNWEESNKL